MKRYRAEAILLAGAICIVIAGLLSGWGVVIGMIGVMLVVMAIFREG